MLSKIKQYDLAKKKNFLKELTENIQYSVN